MRIAFYIVLALNVVYLAWAGWIDAPSAPAAVASESSANLQQLTLVSEESRNVAQLTQVVPGNEPAAQSMPAVVDATASNLANRRCVSVGPFNDLARAARGAALLRTRGFDPKQRAEAGEMWEGYWVYVAGLNSAADEAKLMKALDRAGISDAQTMPLPDGARRVSIGLFSERDRAEKRADAVKRLGFAAEITERKQPGTVYWVDLDLGVSERTVPTEGLLSKEDANARLEIRVCPANSVPASPSRPQLPRDSRPAATTADAGAPRPG